MQPIIEDLPALVRTAAEATPERVYLQPVDAAPHTFADVHAAGAAWARAFRRAGVQPGETVVVFAGTEPDTVEAWLGISRAGAIEVPVNTQLRGRLLHHVLTDAGARTAVVDFRWLDRFTDLPPEVTRTLDLIVVLHPPPGVPAVHGTVRLIPVNDFLASARADAPVDHPLERAAVASIIYTSGTTGPSKGVNVTWAQLAATATGSAPISDLGTADIYYNPYPLYHISGKFAVLRQAMIRSTAVLREGFDTARFWDDVDRYQCTTTLLLGATANFLYRQPERAEDRHTPLRDVLMVPLIPETEDFRRRFGVRVSTTFNMTELSAPLGTGWEPPNTRTCGRPRDGYECRIVDEAGRDVGPGEPGQLLVRAQDRAVLNAGYRNRPDATADAWRDGWFHTGDAFIRDEDGNYYFVDRIKDAIRRRGENISSAELEADVLAHPDVLECAAVAVPSEWGEDDVKIVVVPRPGRTLSPPDLVGFLAGRVAKFMVPRYVDVVGELPKTPTQKIRKNVLREAGITPSTWDRDAARRTPPQTAEGGIR